MQFPRKEREEGKSLGETWLLYVPQRYESVWPQVWETLCVPVDIHSQLQQETKGTEKSAALSLSPCLLYVVNKMHFLNLYQKHK